MPIYEYRCPNGHTFEVFQRMSDPPVEACETCGASPVEKVLFPVAVHFKGSGFYSTDYGRGRQEGRQGRRRQRLERQEGACEGLGHELWQGLRLGRQEDCLGGLISAHSLRSPITHPGA